MGTFTSQEPDAAALPYRLLRDKLICLLATQQEAIDGVKLAAYAADAMRVLGVLGRHADISKDFDDVVKAICPDWRNPGSLEDSADLIVVALHYAASSLQASVREAEQLLTAPA